MTTEIVVGDDDIYENGDFDQLQDVARAGFGDMLHGTDFQFKMTKKVNSFNFF